MKGRETCNCKCRLDASVCNSKQCWNKDKFTCECKEFIEKGISDNGFFWNPSNCECECDKSWDVGEYLDYANCQGRKKLVDKLVEKCNENINEVKIAGIAIFERKSKCKFSCTIYVVLTVIVFTMSIGIGTYFIYYRYINHDIKNCF